MWSIPVGGATVYEVTRAQIALQSWCDCLRGYTGPDCSTELKDEALAKLAKSLGFNIRDIKISNQPCATTEPTAPSPLTGT
eukprot:gene13124-3444_t